jgi:uracil phosphoribosyltransferase
MALTVVGHPLTEHYMSILRDTSTCSEQFRETTRRLAYTLVMEATSDLGLDEYELTSPMGQTTGYRLNRQLVAVAVLRAGLGLLDAVIDLLPNVKVGYAGVQRDEKTALPQEYYTKFPDLAGTRALVLEPMLATGGSLSWAVERLKQAGADDITALCVVAAPDGVARMEADHPDVRVVAAALDTHLNDQFYIVPGLGDMGDRLFGTL